MILTPMLVIVELLGCRATLAHLLSLFWGCSTAQPDCRTRLEYGVGDLGCWFMNQSVLGQVWPLLGGIKPLVEFEEQVDLGILSSLKPTQLVPVNAKIHPHHAVSPILQPTLCLFNLHLYILH